MKSYFLRRLGLASVLLLVVTACGSAASEENASGAGHSDLAPTFEPSPSKGRTGEAGARAGQRTSGADRAGSRGGRADDGRAPASGGGAGGGPRAAGGDESPARVTREGGAARPGSTAGDGGAAADDPGPVRVDDATGDLSASTESAPASADIVGVVVDRTGDRVEVRTTFAGPVPTRQTSSKGMNVASFYDVDGNGYVDYEIWASLADDGWGTGYLDDRRNEASFGAETGIKVTVRGDTLVVTFPWDRIGSAREFRWQAASEWGSYESMAASTSARDRAPDQGAAGYPG